METMKRIWKVTEIVKHESWVEAESRKEAKLVYMTAGADDSTTLKLTATPESDQEIKVYK